MPLGASPPLSYRVTLFRRFVLPPRHPVPSLLTASARVLSFSFPSPARKQLEGPYDTLQLFDHEALHLSSRCCHCLHRCGRCFPCLCRHSHEEDDQRRQAQERARTCTSSVQAGDPRAIQPSNPCIYCKAWLTIAIRRPHSSTQVRRLGPVLKNFAHCSSTFSGTSDVLRSEIRRASLTASWRIRCRECELHRPVSEVVADELFLGAV